MIQNSDEKFLQNKVYLMN